MSTPTKPSESSTSAPTTPSSTLASPATETGSLAALAHQRQLHSPMLGASSLSANSPSSLTLQSPERHVDAEERKKLVYTAAFNRYDLDGSGSIDRDEFVSMIRDLKWNMTDQEVTEAINELDKSQNGRIELDEFLKWSSFAWNHRVTRVRKDSQSLITPLSPSPSTNAAIEDNKDNAHTPSSSSSLPSSSSSSSSSPSLPTSSVLTVLAPTTTDVVKEEAEEEAE